MGKYFAQVSYIHLHSWQDAHWVYASVSWLWLKGPVRMFVSNGWLIVKLDGKQSMRSDLVEVCLQSEKLAIICLIWYDINWIEKGRNNTKVVEMFLFMLSTNARTKNVSHAQHKDGMQSTEDRMYEMSCKVLHTFPIPLSCPTLDNNGTEKCVYVLLIKSITVHLIVEYEVFNSPAILIMRPDKAVLRDFIGHWWQLEDRTQCSIKIYDLILYHHSIF